MAGRKRVRNCIGCGTPITAKGITGYCDPCSRKNRTQEYVNKWLETGTLPIGPNTRPRYIVRDYIMQSQDNKCAICSCDNFWNGKELIFVLDHIDGKSIHNDRKNLRLICPNCDSQLPTYKSKNKNSTRTYDKEHRKEMSIVKEA